MYYCLCENHVDVLIENHVDEPSNNKIKLIIYKNILMFTF